MTYRLLLIEDDPNLIRALTDLLQSDGYVVDVADDGPSALDIARQSAFDVFILDVMLPSMNGFEVCRELRRLGVEAPILMLTARDQVDDKIRGFKSGADDYLTKPFDVNELRVRVEALLRRASRTGLVEFTECTFGDVHIDFARLEINRAGQTIRLSEREGRLLRYFLENRGRVISRDTLLLQVWGYATAPYTRTVDVHILRLRQKIEEDSRNPKFIITVHGFGYRFNG
jgi:DNA-binding response OmpR family regulator